MRTSDILGIALLSLIWGSNFLLVDEALEGLQPIQIVMVRLFLSGLALFTAARLLRTRLPRGAGLWLRLAVLGLVGQGLPWLFFALGQREVPSAMAGVYTGLTPLLTIPIAWLLLHKTPSHAEVIAAVVGFAGLVVVLAPWREQHIASLGGQLMCLAGAACYAINFGYSGRLLRFVEDPKLAVSTGQAMVGFVLMIPLSVGKLTEPMRITWLIALCLGLLGAGTAIAVLVNYWLITRIGPAQASVAFYLIPVVAVAVGILVRNERLTGNELWGSALIFVALGALYVWRRLAEAASTRSRRQGSVT